MKIRGWEIDGFGALRDVFVGALPDGLTVVHGANEAGKSTLLEFVRRVLFGVPPAAASYAPLYGGAHGGRLLVGADDGDYVVARDLDRDAAPAVRRPDGRVGGAADLSRLLGGADERLFRAAFAFTLDDLQSLAGLDGAAVREALFSASLAGAGRSARRALQLLRDQPAAQLNGSGPAPVTDRIAALNALRPRLAAARRAALAYPELRAAQTAAAAEAASLAHQLAAQRQAQLRAQSLLRAWPLWQARQAAREALADLADAAPLPADFDRELAQARAHALAARGAVEALAAEQAAAGAQLAAIPATDLAGAIGAELDALSADLTLHRFQLATVPAARARCDEAEATWQARAQRLAGSPPSPQIAGSAAAQAAAEPMVRDWGRLGIDREHVRDWQARLLAAEQRTRQAQLRAEAALHQVTAIERQSDAIRARIAAREPLPAAELEAQRHRIGALRETVEAMLDKRTRGEAMAQTLRERERVLRSVDADEPSGPAMWLAPVLGTGGAAAAALAAWSMAVSMPAATVALLVALGAGAGAAQVLRMRRAALVRSAQREAQRRIVRSELEAARRGRDQAWHAAAELAEQLARDGEALGLPRSPTSADLDAALRGLEADDAARRTTATARTELAELEPTWRAAEAAAASRNAERAAAEAARDEADAEWDAWVQRAGVGALREPQQVLDRVAALQAAHEALQARDAATRELRQLAPMVAAWEARARAALARGGDADAVGLAGEALVERIAALRARVKDAAPRLQRRAALAVELDERAARLAAAEAQRAHSEAALAALLARVGLRDEEALTARRAAVSRRAELARLIDERTQLLRERLDWDGGETVLASGALETWHAEAEIDEAALAGLEARRVEAQASAEHAAQACRALEESDEVPTLEAEWAGLTSELDDAVRDWRQLAAAQCLIELARQELERTRQPVVLRAASQALGAVTGGRYQRVMQDDTGQGLLVVERDGQVKPAGDALSRGTTEQLYLAVRLGLADELAARGTALPLVMDDVLVNFDPERARAMAALLGDFARRHQVLFFTCHPAMRDLLLAEGHAARVVEL